MKTIRLTWIALSIAALLLVAVAPPASAGCTGAACLSGTYAFRLDPATSFAANLAFVPTSDPGQVGTAPSQDVIRAGQFTSDGNGHITAGETFVVSDDPNGTLKTFLIDYNFTGTYTPDGSDSTNTLGTLSVAPDPSSSWKCYDMTSSAGPGDWAPVSPYSAWPNLQIMPTVGNAGNFVYQPATPPDWIASHYYPNLYTSTVQIVPLGGNPNNYAFRRSAIQSWAANTPYPTKFQIVPAAANNPGGYLYQVTTPGTSGAAAAEPNPFNQTVGGTQIDGTVTWTNENAILGKTGAAGKEPSWPTSIAVFAPSLTTLACTSPGFPWGCCTGFGTGTCPPTTAAGGSTAVTGAFTTDGGIMWMNEGPAGTSGALNGNCTARGLAGTTPAQCCTGSGTGTCAEPSWNQAGQLTNDQGITWALLGNSSLTPIKCDANAACTGGAGHPYSCCTGSDAGTCTFEAPETYSTSLSPHHGVVELVETDNSGGGPSSGTGTKIFMTGEAVQR